MTIAPLSIVFFLQVAVTLIVCRLVGTAEQRWALLSEAAAPATELRPKQASKGEVIADYSAQNWPVFWVGETDKTGQANGPAA